jgi:hypothetical protein
LRHIFTLNLCMTTIDIEALHQEVAPAFPRMHERSLKFVLSVIAASPSESTERIASLQ